LIGCLDEANCSVGFRKGMCTIKNSEGCTMATIPCVNGLYHLLGPSTKSYLDQANVAAGKMSISEAHCKLGHISHTTIKHAISTGQITGIELDMDLKPNFCEPCIIVFVT
jgi:hypothetical protein